MDSLKPADIVELVEKKDSPEHTITIPMIIPTFIDTVLYKAAAKGEIEPFNNACTEPLDHLLTPTKNTILHINITQRRPSIPFLGEILTKCLSLLLKTNNKGETPLHMAARHGCHTIVKFLIDSAKDQHQLDIETGVGAARAMLRMTNIREETALHEAARHNHVNVVQVLIEEDPDFAYSANKDGETPLYLAAERGFWDIALRILNTCTSPAYDGPNGRTALHEAVIRNGSGMTTKILEKNKSLVKEVDKQGWAPLHYASHFGYFAIVKQLIDCDKSVAYIHDKNGKIPLHLAAAAAGDSKLHGMVVYYILKHCPDCHELVDGKGRNVLHFAMQSGNDTLLNDMFTYPDDDHFKTSLANLINEKDVDGNTPLHMAATYCVYSYLLIKHPLVDKMALNNNNSTALDIILESGDEHSEGLEGATLGTLMKAGYEKSQRNFIEEKETLPDVIAIEELERHKNAHMLVAALIATVTFAAGFTMPGGYNSEEGSAILSRNGAFKTFIITDAIALLLSTCALFFHFIWGAYGLSKRRLEYLFDFAANFIMLAIILMLMAFAAGVYAVLPHSSNVGASICVIIGFFVLICYSPLKHLIKLNIGIYTFE